MVDLPCARDLDDPVKRDLAVAVDQKAHSQTVLLPAVVGAAAAAAVEDELHSMVGHHNWDLQFCSAVEDLAGCSAAAAAAALELAEVASRALLYSAQSHCGFLEKVIDLDGMALQFELRDKAVIDLAVD